ncbi:sonic hedgehog protein-like isoform X1 [Styela clava]
MFVYRIQIILFNIFQRCRDCLNRLAIMVAEKWKNKVILRVVEAWDEDGAHEPNSLHYEGRAVDITTNDTDRSKYGILARLAVEAGFDWVYYQSKFHVHCSVKSDKSDAARYGGCFAGDSVAYRPDGTTVQMSQLLPGDSILSVDWRGRVVVDKIISFMDRIPPSKKKDIQSSMKFLQISTENGNVLKLTRNHLLYAIKSQDPDSDIDTGQDRLNSAKFIYAESVEVGDYVLETHASSNKTNFLHRKTKLSRVGSVTAVTSDNGAYAPLTEQGTILVNGVAASCYAVFNSHKIAHWTMAPLRLYNKLHDWRVEQPLWRDIPIGVPWYPRFLYKLGSAFFSEYMYQI